MVFQLYTRRKTWPNVCICWTCVINSIWLCFYLPRPLPMKLILPQPLQIFRFGRKHLSRLRFSWSLFSQRGNEDKSFFVKGESPESGEVSKRPMKPIFPKSLTKNRLYFTIFLHCSRLLSFFRYFFDLYYINPPFVFFPVQLHADSLVLQHVVPNIFRKVIDENNIGENLYIKHENKNCLK